MKKLKLFVVLLMLILFSKELSAQQKPIVSFVGGARSLITNNRIYVNDTVPDTATVKRNTGGYALIDLGVNIRPNKYTEILGMFRISNAYGGFWGSGVSFDVRQLWLKGIIGNVIRYQVGDLNLKQTPFTLYNHHADRIDSLPAIFSLQNEIIDYEKYYFKNTWHQQGINVDFGLNFKKFIKEIEFTGYLTRLAATNFTTVPDRLMGGGTINILQSEHINFGYNNFSVFDVKGTVPDTNVYTNFVNTINLGYNKDIKIIHLSINAELGKSTSKYSQYEEASSLKDNFVNTYAALSFPKQNLTATLGYLNVGNEFRSIGAQSKDVNYATAPTYYDRYTNEQTSRPLSMFDVMTSPKIYNPAVSSNLMQTNPIYNNVLPYGIATFNRMGVYIKANYDDTKGIVVNAEQYFLSEIKGQGTTYLKQFSQTKLTSQFEINKLAHFKRIMKVQVGVNLQSTKRNSNEEVENVKLNSTEFHFGFEYEFIPKIDVLLGFVGLTNQGNEFEATLDQYSKPLFYSNVNYNLMQSVYSGGLRCRFGDKTHLTAMYQYTDYNDKQINNAPYQIGQFALLFNMTF